MPLVSEEAIERVAKQAEMGTTYLVFMSTAGVLAAVALLTNSIPVLIGAMIVAPAFAPLALVAFAVTGGKPALALRGFVVAAVGLGISTAFAMLTTWIMNTFDVLPPDANLLNKDLLEERVTPGW